MFKRSSSNSGLSNLSLDSISEDELQPWHGLIQKLSISYLEQLRIIFKRIIYDSTCSIGKPREGLDEEQFIRAIDEVFGNCKHSLQASLLFAEIDKENKKNIIWNQFLDFIIDEYSTESDQIAPLDKVVMFNSPHVKRDTIAKIVLIETEKYFCYAILSKYGHVGLYDGNMNFLTSYQMIMTREDINRKEEQRRRRNRWVTDAIFVKDILMLFITTSTRSITIYDASGLTHTPLWMILGIPNIIESICWHSNYVDENHILFMGDEKGQLLSITFLHFSNELLRKKHSDKLSFFYWIQLYEEKGFMIIKNYGRLHKNSITKMHYCCEKNVISTCSKDEDKSIEIKRLNNKTNTYVFKIHRGATCFSISHLLKILITGNDIGLINVWNIVVTLKPISILKSHKTGLVDLQIVEGQGLFLSCSKDAVLKVWSIKDFACLQSLRIKFPSFYVLGKRIEWGTQAIYPGPKQYTKSTNANVRAEQCDLWERSHIFVSCCNYIAKVKLDFSTEVEVNSAVLPPPPLQNSVLVPTHWRISENSNYLSRSPSKNAKETNEEKITDYIQSLNFILKKDFLTENNLRSDINYQLARLEENKLKMEMVVSKCAPYLALNLPTIEELRLSPNLPITASKRIKNIIDKTNQLLSESGTRSHTSFEQTSSSRTQSSRSSIITFE